VGTQRPVTVSWTLSLDRGPATSGSRQVSVPPDGKVDVTFDIPVPSVKTATPGTLEAKVLAGSDVLYQ
jgi:hypothetical protein